MKIRTFWSKDAAEEFATEVNGTVVRESIESVGLDDRDPCYLVYFD